MGRTPPGRRGRSSGAGSADDAALVTAALAGDRDAFAAVYDRYADRVHSMCVHLLGDRDDAADVTAEVFLVAAERLGQLRDPSRLKPWLFAITRRQVWLRTRRRSRTVAVEEVDDMGHEDLVTDHDAVERAADARELATLVRSAAAGLDDGDRTVLELTLAGLVGADLADALGVSDGNAAQAAHRMRERLGRSVGALLVARQGRADCGDLDRLLADWDGRFSVLWRKRVARHVDRCEVCERRRKGVPALLLEGVAAASPVAAVPISVRDRVLADARIGGATGRPWPGDGFPPADGRGRRRAAVAALTAAVLLLVAGLVASPLFDAADDVELVAGEDAVASSTTTVAVPTTAGLPEPAPTTVPVGGPPAGDAPPATVAPPSTEAPPTVPAPPTTLRPRPTAPPTAPPTTAAPTTTTVPTSTTTTTTVPDRDPPKVSIVVPLVCPGGTTITATAVDASPVTSVTLRWTDGAGVARSAPMQRAGGGWRVAFSPQGPPKYRVSAEAVDAAGNRGQSGTRECTILPG